MQCINTQLVFLCNSALTWPPWLPNHPTWVVQTTEHIEAESACLAVPNQVYPPSPHHTTHQRLPCQAVRCTPRSALVMEN